MVEWQVGDAAGWYCRWTLRVVWKQISLFFKEIPSFFFFSYVCYWLKGGSPILLRISQFSRSAMANSLQPHGLQYSGLPCSSPTPGACSNSCPLSQWCHPTILSSVIPFSSCLQSFPASVPFLITQFFTSGGQNIGASTSASVLPKNTQDWFPLGLIGLISLQSKALSRVFSSTTVQKHHSLVLSFLYSPTLTSIHDYWENHSLDQMDLCWQSNVSAF